jgi:hypothetical protein
MTILSEEDETFNDIERQAKQRKEAVTKVFIWRMRELQIQAMTSRPINTRS